MEQQAQQTQAAAVAAVVIQVELAEQVVQA
jgi:hypothetical protein